jgi:hypothetical protein
VPVLIPDSFCRSYLEPDTRNFMKLFNMLNSEIVISGCPLRNPILTVEITPIPPRIATAMQGLKWRSLYPFFPE